MKIWLHMGEIGFIQVNFSALFRFIMAWHLYVEGIFSHIFFKQIFLKLAIFKTYRHGSFSFFADQSPFGWDREWFLPWIFLGKTQKRLVLVVVGQGRSGFPTKSHHFCSDFSRSRSFGFLSLLGDLGQRCRVIEGPVGGRETVFFKGKNYSGFNMIYWSKRRVYHYVMYLFYIDIVLGDEKSFFLFKSIDFFCKNGSSHGALFHDFVDLSGPTAC